MNAFVPILFGWILNSLTVAEVSGRAIPDFNTDEDLDAWHNFGLRSFYGPWGVLARKSNGDFVSYADYGTKIPTDFRPIANGANGNDDVDSAARISRGDRAELSDLVGGYEKASSENDIQHSDTEIHGSRVDLNERENNSITLELGSDFEEVIKAIDGKTMNKESKVDTLELIAIVGVIGSDGDYSEDDSTTVLSIETTTDGGNEDDRGNVDV